ncbi:MAG: DNA translocase FtsK 4TM domain-containing protein [Acidocella sp.]
MAVDLGAQRLISPAMRAQLRRRMAELMGLFLALVALVLLLAIVTYNPADPSFDTASGASTTNLAGPPGALLADLLLQ